MEQTNVVTVQFFNKRLNDFSSKEYHYIADVPLAVGDIVTVPTRNGEGEARVARINVPEAEVEPWMHDRLQHITSTGTVGNLFDEFFK